ncbi:MAG TPA: UbiA family prenyltransferase [Calditrichia bacterium]|nr:UbiA family prenyltransferase [Calditrichia bacterium]
MPNTRLQHIASLIRWKDWALDKLPILYMLCFYLMLTEGRDAWQNTADFLIFAVFSITSTIYGYVINNYADLDIDLRQGKNNDLAAFSPAVRTGILVGITVLVLLSGSRFLVYEDFWVLWAIQFFIATFYSMPPIRFKERGLIGLIIPFAAQMVVPTLICFSIFGSLHHPHLWVFIAYAVFKGGAYDIGHQFYDYEGDVKTSTKTFAVTHGQEKVAFGFRLFLVLERLAFLAILWVWVDAIGAVITFRGLSPIWPVLGGYLLLFALLVVRELRQKHIIDPYYQEIRGLANVLHIIIPNILVPALLTFLLSLMNSTYLVILGFYFIWVMPTPAKLKWPLQVIGKLFK